MAKATAHPLGNVWDNGADPVKALEEAMAVRKLALDNFGADRIHPGQPISDLNKVIVPIYLYHRYQTAAAAKSYPAFDVTAAADTAADLTFDVLLNPRRAARLIEFKRRDADNLGLMDVLQTTRAYVMRRPANDRTGEIAKTVQARFAFALMDLSNSDATPSVKARTDKVLRDILHKLTPI